MTAPGVVDEKVGLSSLCRREPPEHGRCKSLGAKCSCRCHGRSGQVPPQRAVRPTVADIDAERAKRSCVVWEEPPASASGGRRSVIDRLAPQLEELEAHIGMWGRIATFAGRSSANTAAGRLRKAKGPDWEFRAARDDDGSKLYGRYIGK